MEKPGKRSSISAGISVYYSSLQTLFLYPLLFSWAILAALSLTLVLVHLAEGGYNCREKLLFSRQAVNITALSGGKYSICQQRDAVWLTTFCWLVLEYCVLICGTPKHKICCPMAFLLPVWNRQEVTVAQINVIQPFWREFTASSYQKFCSLFTIAVQGWQKKNSSRIRSKSFR